MGLAGRTLEVSRAIVAALLLTAATAQSYPYGYPMGYPMGYPYVPPTEGYQYDPNLGMSYGYPAGQGFYPSYGGNAAGEVGQIMADLLAGQNYYMGQMDQMGQQIDAQIAQYNKYFIDLYRTTTGDMSSPDAYALEWGKYIHCQRYPLDCQLAAQGSKASMEAQQGNFDAFMAGVQAQSAANDQSFGAWMSMQDSQQASHDAYVRGAIQGVGEYGDPNTGTSYYLPFAPSQGTYYQTPAGLPLVFDPSQNTWYQIEVDGTFTPYSEVQ
ncbi:MAG: hypothetical protein ROY82_09805 [Truepera sp.]|jgi:hypothetical protein|nr:hypothetical protein [Truepera sp.]